MPVEVVLPKKGVRGAGGCQVCVCLFLLVGFYFFFFLLDGLTSFQSHSSSQKRNQRKKCLRDPQEYLRQEVKVTEVAGFGGGGEGGGGGPEAGEVGPV